VAQKDRKSKSESFVGDVIEKLQGQDTSFGAMMRRADNPATGYQSWQYLCRWCNIENTWEHKPYALIGAALARAKPRANGRLGIGQAIVLCYSSEGTFDGAKHSAAQIRLRRLLSCTSGEEACAILRPLLSLISSRQINLDYAELLNDLSYSPEYFNDHIRAKWARNFYYKKEEE
jgi:CRISPR system Cascade subunit CasB